MSVSETKKSKILIVEDERALSDILKLKLETDAHFDVKTAPDGQEAINILDKEHFDVILLDLVMPDTDGFEVLENIRHKSISTPVIIASNLGDSVNQKRARSLGAREYFIKSEVTLNDIVEQIRGIVSEGQG